MIIDKENYFGKDKAFTSQGTAALGDDIDLTKGGDAIDQLWLVIQCSTTPTSSGSATVGFALITDDAANFSGAATLLNTGQIGFAGIVAGKWEYKTKIPMGVKRFLRLNNTVGTADLTAGKFTAFLTSGVDKLE